MYLNGNGMCYVYLKIPERPPARLKCRKSPFAQPSAHRSSLSQVTSILFGKITLGWGAGAEDLNTAIDVLSAPGFLVWFLPRHIGGGTVVGHVHRD